VDGGAFKQQFNKCHTCHRCDITDFDVSIYSTNAYVKTRGDHSKKCAILRHFETWLLELMDEQRFTDRAGNASDGRGEAWMGRGNEDTVTRGRGDAGTGIARIIHHRDTESTEKTR
jgi:hypothetical protein